MASFWDTFGPGMIQTGGNFFLQNRASKEAEDRLKRAQGPLFAPMMDQAGRSLALAGTMDPMAMARDRFTQQQALLAPGQQADQQALLRELQAKGMLGAASFSPVAGTVATPGQPMNPQMAALLAAQEGAKSKAAFDSMREGETYLDNLLRRSSGLQQTAQSGRASGVNAMRGIPAKPTFAETLVRGGMNVLKDKEARDLIFKGASGMFGSAMDWLRPSNIPSWLPEYDFGNSFEF